MITTVSCGLSLQVTCSLVHLLPCLPYKQLVHLSTRSYVTISSLQATCSLVHLLTRLLEQFIFTKQIRERIEINLKQVISASL